MRALVIAAVFLGSSSLYPSYAEDEGKTAPVFAPQTAPAQDKENTAPQQNQRTQTEQPKTDDREVGRDWRIHPSDGDRRNRVIVWAVVTGRRVVTGECIEIVRQIETATWIAADTESEGTEMGTAEIGTAAGITMTTDPAVA
jgi:hypothetical protein